MKVTWVYGLVCLLAVSVSAQDKPDDKPANGNPPANTPDQSQGKVPETPGGSQDKDTKDDKTNKDDKDDKTNKDDKGDKDDKTNKDGKDKDSKDGSSGKDGDSDGKKDKKTPYVSPRITITHPLYVESIKKAQVSIDRTTTFKWTFSGTPKTKPDSLTFTLVEKKATEVSYVIKSDIGANDTSFDWDVQNYVPSTNPDEMISLKPGGIYRVFIYDSALKYNTLSPMGRYSVGSKEFEVYASGDPNSKFGSGALLNMATPLASIASLLASAYFIFAN